MVPNPDGEESIQIGGKTKRMVKVLQISKMNLIQQRDRLLEEAERPSPTAAELTELHLDAQRGRIGADLGAHSVSVSLCELDGPVRTTLPNMRLRQQDAATLQRLRAWLVKTGAEVETATGTPGNSRIVPVQTDQDALRWMLQNLKPAVPPAVLTTPPDQAEPAGAAVESKTPKTKRVKK